MARPDLAAVPAQPAPASPEARPESLVESYRRLAEVFHLVLSEQSVDTLLDRIADTLADLVPYGALHVYEADVEQRILVPVLARSDWAAEIMRSNSNFGEGITGWAVEQRTPVLTNQAHLDPRVIPDRAHRRPALGGAASRRGAGGQGGRGDHRARGRDR